MTKPIYDKRGWVLALCQLCGALNYVEPHGTTAYCRCKESHTEHDPIPRKFRNRAGDMLVWRGGRAALWRMMGDMAAAARKLRPKPYAVPHGKPTRKRRSVRSVRAFSGGLPSLGKKR